ncbi:MAG TPA: hypothetical protein VGO59_18095 [Verrucomicrobiae bacterium]|jgi:hypothetical protein
MIKVEQLLPLKDRFARKPLTFGEFVAGVYQTCGKRKAKGIVQLAVAVNLVEFRGADRFVIS